MPAVCPLQGHVVTEPDECPHGLDRRWCTTCLHGPARRPTEVSVEATFPARYDGQCPRCDLPIAVGRVIHRLSDETYVHEGCW